MEAWITGFVGGVPLVLLFLIIAVAIGILVKGADLLVDQAVSLSVRWGVPKMLIGATIVSIGTTLPEAAVSVFAAIKGAPGLAMGNAVGSIIANTGLILGLAVLIGRVPVDPKLVNRQIGIQMSSAILLVVVCVPFLSLDEIFVVGGKLPQLVGVAFLLLLSAYIWRSIAWSKSAPPDAVDDSTMSIHRDVKPLIAIAELLLGVAMVFVGSQILIPAVEETAIRLQIPDAIIAATLVAFGTSLPELVTAVTAVRKGHGELAIGNVLGANVLNVLFVSGAAAAVTRNGLNVPPQFFYLFFPSLLFIVLVLRIGVGRTSHQLSKSFGFVLLLAYVITVILGFLVPDTGVATASQ